MEDMQEKIIESQKRFLEMLRSKREELQKLRFEVEERMSKHQLEQERMSRDRAVEEKLPAAEDVLPAAAENVRPLRLQIEFVSAQSVCLAGSFNHWTIDPANRQYLPMVRNDQGVWYIEMHLNPGRYEYKFLVDGLLWLLDPNNPQVVSDASGNQNSLLVIN